MKKIYLCGKIQDLTTEQANNWREIVINKLNGKYICLNPMRRNFRDCEFQSQNEIVQLDKNDIINSDVILVNATKPSWGTAMEILFAFERHKIIIAFTGGSYKQTSPWVAFHSTRICKTMDEALEYIIKQL